MKKTNQLLTTTILISVCIFQFSCGNNSKTKTDDSFTACDCKENINMELFAKNHPGFPFEEFPAHREKWVKKCKEKYNYQKTEDGEWYEYTNLCKEGK